MAHLLYLANGPKFQSIAKLDDRFEDFGLKVDRYWAYKNQFPENLTDYDGIFFSGSPHGAYEDIPFIRKEHELIESAAEQDIPMLGICFGSQILASALCGGDQVFRRSSCEIGYKTLSLANVAWEDPIVGKIGSNLEMFVWHNDEIRGEHEDICVLASSDLCENQIWRWRDKNVWGVQGHPEITRDQALIWFEENRSRMEKDGASVDELKSLAQETAESKKIITRFADLVKKIA